MSPSLFHLLCYMKALLLLKLTESENVDLTIDKQEERISLLKKSEDTLRQSLRGLSNTLEILHLCTEISILESKDEDNRPLSPAGFGSKPNTPQIDASARSEAPSPLTILKNTLTNFQKEKGITSEELAVFYCNEEESKLPLDLNNQLLIQIIRNRLLLIRIYKAQGFNLDAYFTVKTAIFNFKAYCCGERKVETSEDKKGSFVIPEGVIGSAAAGKGAPAKGKAPPPAAPPPDKGDKRKKGKGAVDEAKDPVLLEDEGNQEKERIKAELEAREGRLHPPGFYWLKLKSQLLDILFIQGRYDDCLQMIQGFNEECVEINVKLKQIFLFV